MSETETEYRAAFRTGAASQVPQNDVTAIERQEVPYIVVPEGYRTQDIEGFAKHPAQTRHTIDCQNVDTFCRYWDKFKNDSSVILADKNALKPSFKAIFDFDSKETPAWKHHAATYLCPMSIEWGIWRESDKRSMTQEVFAQFIEDNVVDIVYPDHATMLETSRSLVAKRKVDFHEAISLNNGARQFTYSENIKGTVNKGTIEVPETFVIGISVFVDEPKVQTDARLRYRIPADGGHLIMWYELVRPQKVIEAAFNTVAEKIKAATQTEILFATI